MKPLNDGNERIQLIQVGEWIVINAYLPCRGNHSHDEFCSNIDLLNEICTKYSKYNLVLAGDLNVDILKHEKERVKYIQNFLKTHGLKEFCELNSPTLEAKIGSSKIDYILTSTSLVQGSIYKILQPSPINTSPHHALLLSMKNVEINEKKEKAVSIERIMWEKADIPLYF